METDKFLLLSFLSSFLLVTEQQDPTAFFAGTIRQQEAKPNREFCANGYCAILFTKTKQKDRTAGDECEKLHYANKHEVNEKVLELLRTVFKFNDETTNKDCFREFFALGPNVNSWLSAYVPTPNLLFFHQQVVTGLNPIEETYGETPITLHNQCTIAYFIPTSERDKYANLVNNTSDMQIFATKPKKHFISFEDPCEQERCFVCVREEIKCPPKYTFRPFPDEGACYFANTELLTFKEAQKTCQRTGGSLLLPQPEQIHSQNEINLIPELFSGDFNCFFRGGANKETDVDVKASSESEEMYRAQAWSGVDPSVEGGECSVIKVVPSEEENLPFNDRGPFMSEPILIPCSFVRCSLCRMIPKLLRGNFLRIKSIENDNETIAQLTDQINDIKNDNIL